MKSIEELQAELKKLYVELEEWRIAEREAVPQSINFNKISSKAERYKISNHPMSEKTEMEQQMYLLLLLSVVALDDTSYEKSFSLLYRISYGMGFQGDVQELFLKAQQINFDDIDEITRIFLNDDIRLLLLMECVMLAQSFQEKKKRAMEYVAELCVLMKLRKEQVILIANVARAILSGKASEYRCDIANVYCIFDCYISKFEPTKHIMCIDDKKIASPSRDVRNLKIENISTNKNQFIFNVVGNKGSIGNIFFKLKDGTDGTDGTKEDRVIDIQVPYDRPVVYSYKKTSFGNRNYSNYLFDITPDMTSPPQNVAVCGDSMLFYSYAKRIYPEMFQED